MSALRYVCLSDLHLGADYSVLTHMAEDGATALDRPSETLAAFGVALRETVRALSPVEPPTLILLGDALDLGLSSTGAVSQGFRRFLEALFPADAPFAFSPRLLCVPGNHDHRLWRSAQEGFFLEHLPNYPPGAGPQAIPSLWRSQLFSQRTARCQLMTQLMRGYAHLAEATVNVAYPNLGLLDAGGRRCVVLHHGHYIDDVYRAMSALSGALRGADPRPRDVLQLERENGAWVDFLWSSLGGGGRIERTAVALYETMRSPAASHHFAERLGSLLLGRLAAATGISADTEVKYGITVASLVRGAVDATLLRAAQSDRDGYYSAMSAASVADLRWYLDGPVREQLVEADKLSQIEDMSFVFGHTHKPFQDQLDARHYDRPVAVYNTGGWVMDQPTMAPAQGAAAILIDEAMNVASLRLFNDPLNGPCAPVRVAGLGGFRDADNALLEAAARAVRGAQPAWDAFTARVAEALALHAQSVMHGRFEDEISA